MVKLQMLESGIVNWNRKSPVSPLATEPPEYVMVTLLVLLLVMIVDEKSGEDELITLTLPIAVDRSIVKPVQVNPVEFNTCLLMLIVVSARPPRPPKRSIATELGVIGPVQTSSSQTESLLPPAGRVPARDRLRLVALILVTPRHRRPPRRP